MSYGDYKRVARGCQVDLLSQKSFQAEKVTWGVCVCVRSTLVIFAGGPLYVGSPCKLVFLNPKTLNP